MTALTACAEALAILQTKGIAAKHTSLSTMGEHALLNEESGSDVHLGATPLLCGISAGAMLACRLGLWPGHKTRRRDPICSQEIAKRVVLLSPAAQYPGFLATYLACGPADRYTS